MSSLPGATWAAQDRIVAHRPDAVSNTRSQIRRARRAGTELGPLPTRCVCGNAMAFSPESAGWNRASAHARRKVAREEIQSGRAAGGLFCGKCWEALPGKGNFVPASDSFTSWSFAGRARRQCPGQVQGSFRTGRREVLTACRRCIHYGFDDARLRGGHARRGRRCNTWACIGGSEPGVECAVALSPGVCLGAVARSGPPSQHLADSYW